MEKKIISVSDEIRKVCPAFVGGIVYAEFNNTQYCEELWAEIKSKAAEMKSRHTVDTIKRTSGIAASRLQGLRQRPFAIPPFERAAGKAHFTGKGSVGCKHGCRYREPRQYRLRIQRGLFRLRQNLRTGNNAWHRTSRRALRGNRTRGVQYRTHASLPRCRRRNRHSHERQRTHQNIGFHHAHACLNQRIRRRQGQGKGMRWLHGRSIPEIP